eukprot:CAMPEP_0194236700 /NCGR_PEP_ID=MMETSP0158-20130606/3892_1 /TAXON_ID=33649 /ORGANISM="Thalassionema nitzschioides, Strain L26-B" /LENGTH=376 /DNA_ID=CAMNT_0038970527 /DNA_START=560 /DNA_END=1690 /DNA_ORIENTATION=-
MRKFVEVSDLGGENTGTTGTSRAASNRVSSDNKIARGELYRMLEDEELSLSRRLQNGAFSMDFQSSRDQAILSKCGITARERSTELLSILSTISDRDELNDPGSTRHRAFDWLDNIDEAIICPSTDRARQRYRVALLYFTLGGSEWKNCGEDSRRCVVSEDDKDIFQNVRWLSKQHECKWFGLYCEGNPKPETADERVMLTDIDLDENNLHGPLPEELFGASSLQNIIMDSNVLTGTIPSNVGYLTNLKIIDLDDNKLEGELPEEFFSITSLEIVDLNTNKFTGTLSSNIKNLVNIRFLQLDQNNMSGDLPTHEILELENLFALTLENNDFTGSLEDICEVYSKRREEYSIYLQYFTANCAESEPDVNCSCCSKCV